MHAAAELRSAWTAEGGRPYASISRWLQVREWAEFANMEIFCSMRIQIKL
jgi:hypothetical protein